MLAVTDGDITMPNMKGWTTDDVLAFQELTGINVTTKGSGYVTNQSVASGSTLKSNKKIEIELSTDDPNDSTSLTDSSGSDSNNTSDNSTDTTSNDKNDS